MDAPLASRLPLEVLHDIRHVGETAIDASFFKRFVEELSCRSDKGLAFEIFVIAGLLADKHYAGFRFAFAKNGLRAFSPEIARLAALGDRADLRQR